MKYAVIRNGRFTGTVYENINERIVTFHMKQGDLIVPLEGDLQPEQVITATVQIDENTTREEVVQVIYPEADLETIKKAKKFEIAFQRWLNEIKGIELDDGTIIQTDRESRAALLETIQMIQLDPSYSARWKGKNKWTEINSSNAMQILQKVRDYVQSLYDREKELQEQIDQAQSVEEVLQIRW